MKQIISFLILFIPFLVIGQDNKTSVFTEKISKYDISDLLTLNEFHIENDTTTVQRMEPLGYIGDNFQRFYIHFISVIQNPNNHLQYFVYGKTKVKENICSFQGTLNIKNSRILEEGDIPPLKQGFVIGDYEFFEDSDQNDTGRLKGNFRTDFYIDEKGDLKYDALMWIADGFSNNQFEGIWTSYNSGESKVCNWGDYRIPNSRGLDIGAAEFSPQKKYGEYGWLNFIKASAYQPKDSDVIKARKKENEKWWLY